MLIIPAIDIKDGKVVRLTKGDFLKVEVYSDDPIAIAKKWEEAGATLIHVVDLDGARKGVSKNLNIVENIIKNVKADIELGGGIREESFIEELINKGVKQIVLGTKALDDQFLASVLKKFKDKIVVSIDSKADVVTVNGWQEAGNVDPIKFAKELEAKGVKKIVYTEVLRDGTLSGPNFFKIEKILDAVNIEVIASGGISSMDDLRRLKTYEDKGLIGVIVGKALYEGKIDLKEAITKMGK
ncbi:MAG: 1-(5-phosphoribosyl)-5-[(5-phosphoribosylamino)methylideneamino]imidazole-4-carboxamide isomerase [Candidatus Omnitrophica bacterium CG07_land_8_20_14_0_80_42_15]|uniref:1-(5-phosphoribosyl)-5-[(5-phosphoribosylamino)methylideneamino] imidazole-4-carboxamide isomerase n=1 Tax=Candidatus Aquitaenariimonas noxiae TaxID=1974741 RepID=A0A2J0KUZ1_9BACT|nr:MAG: 1-(5-phosphoribosyl)-5-[(5-phosphoribosylamino)methylideneamino]imidazole-4-carboxamide isomerase [Candidatus Omnitrophica bacterium CG07_land_8_20_14_0_80_42_15]